MAPILEGERWSMSGQGIASDESSLSDNETKVAVIAMVCVTIGVVASVLVVAIACARGKGEGDEAGKDGKVRKSFSKGFSLSDDRFVFKDGKQRGKITFAKSIVVMKQEGGPDRYEDM